MMCLAPVQVGTVTEMRVDVREGDRFARPVTRKKKVLLRYPISHRTW